MTATQSASMPRLSPIGRPGKPIRVMAFAGGGFDTAMQLGVVHALLVSRARAPDVVIGCSAGAVSAVALAEVLQAGDIDDLGPKVARFRELFEAYRRAPGEIVQALAPDPTQVDTQRPLEPLRLPVFHSAERGGRIKAVAARAGLLNLYNALLNIRLTIGTMARATRCWLGWQASQEIRRPWMRRAAKVSEAVRAWLLLGENLNRAATLLAEITWSARPGKPRQEHGATAAELIFASTLLRWFRQHMVDAAWALVLIGFWLVISGVLLGAVALLGAGVLRLAGFTSQIILLYGLLTGVVIVALFFFALTEPRAVRVILSVFGAFATMALLVIGWATMIGLALSLPLLLVSALRGLVGAKGFLAPWMYPSLYWLLAILSLAALGAITAIYLWAIRRDLWRRLLASFSLDAALLDPDVLRQLLVRVFDPAIYGAAITPETVERALRDDNSPHNGRLDAKLVGDYAYPERASPRLHTAKRRGSAPDLSKQPPPIYVAITVADVATGQLTTVPANVHVVHALLAAVAKPPLFPPVSTNGQLFIDASALTAEPTQALLELLRTSGLVNEQAAVVHLYSVAPFPLGREALGQEFTRDGKPRRYTQLLDVVRRVLQLRRMRDATLERRLTKLHTRSMPRDGGVFFDTVGRRYVRTWVYPIEPEDPLEVNYLTLQANSEETRRRTMAETVADGCRATLQAMMPTAIAAAAANPASQAFPPPGTPPDPSGRIAVRCRAAVEQHLATQGVEHRPLPGAPNTPEHGPGMIEVCEHCALFRPRRTGSVDPHRPPVRPAALLVDSAKTPMPTWPAQEAIEPDWVEPDHNASRSAPSLKQVWQDVWPQPRGGIPDSQRSIVSLLFSGGVFRGVFQVGVLNALSEASLRPDIVAGASVGSITSAMAMRTFLANAYGGASSHANTLTDRQQFMQNIAAAYLAIDRLILTDRFADFVRGLTVRAAQARFSVRDADRVIRRFDASNPWTWSEELRSVVAGLERLAYVSPFELRDVVEAFRRQHYGTGARLLERYFQELLDRAGVGLEVLGAEPLERLVVDYVLQGLGPAMSGAAGRTSLQEFIDHGIFFFATVTNLTEGRLQNIGDTQISGFAADLNLLQSLLASSAFPGVFRRRWSWEVQLSVTRPEEYADGGVIDNLPLDAVASFLENSAVTGLIERRPPVPHLIFSASLETPVNPITDWQVLDRLSRYWPRLQRRAREMAYNRKLDLFARTQQNLREIIKTRGAAFTPGVDWTPLDLEVVTVYPKWLCGTFAFHPMLGFRRCNQAESIAHGCASALIELGRQATGDDGPARAAAWGLDTSHLPDHAQSFAADPFVPVGRPTSKGNCWYRPSVPCPFSTEGQKATGAIATGRTGAELNDIYEACGNAAGTHRPRQPRE